jgi:lipopolysaccharide export system protein LptA
LLFASSLQPARAQQSNSSANSSDKVVLDHADSLRGMEIDGEPVRDLSGHVHFTHGKTIITCNHAVQYLQSNKIQLSGEVIVYDDSMTLFTNRGVYYSADKRAEGFDVVRIIDGKTTIRAGYGEYFSNEHKAFFRTNVVVQDTSSNMYADELTYWRDDQRTIADGHVIIVNRANNITLYGEHFENYRQIKYSLLTKGQRVVQPSAVETDTSGGERDTLIVLCDTMKSYADSIERLVAIDNVTITRNDLYSQSGGAVFFTKLDSIALRKSPFIWVEQSVKETTQVSGDSIFVKMKAHKLERLNVRGDAIAISQADSIHRARYNQMTGDEIIMRFNGKKIQRVDVDRSATMLYYLFDSDKPNGLNKSSGDHGTISFLDGRINDVKMAGGVEGGYYPEKLVKGKEGDFALTGFNWRSPHSSPKKQN